MRCAPAFVLSAASVCAGAAPFPALRPEAAAALAALPSGGRLAVEGFPDGAGGRATLEFRRLEVYAPGARLVAVVADGERELPRSGRVVLVGSDAAGRVRASLAFDPGSAGFGRAGGAGVGPAGAFVLRGGADGIEAVPAAQALPAGVVPEIVPGDDALPSGRAPPASPVPGLPAAAPAGALRAATVAIDTDNEFMSVRFGNDTAAAADWIADLFGAMNVMYQRDLGVTLQQGTTYLRTAADPYAQSGSPANQAELVEFGAYWQAHYGAVPRSFAALLSGKSPSGNSASGIAWIDAYCATAAQGGSYSVSQVFTSAQVPIGYSALIVGHELGHNFGAFHTHCTDAGTGAAPTGSNTIDRCFSGETYSNGSCYSGATSCPASGPGAPAGTVMSYCSNIGCGPNQSNVLQFHPAQVGVLSALIAQHTPSCLAAAADTIFRDGFE